MKKLTLYDAVYEKLDFEAERFINPDNCFFPVYFWTWNAKMEREEIKKQLDEMYEADIRGVLILPEPKEFAPFAKVPTELEPGYLTDAFMEYIRYAVECADQKGMVIWLFDEGGWPSGSAGGQIAKARPDLGDKIISERKAHLNSGEVYKMSEGTVAAYVDGKRIAEGYLAKKDTEVSEYYRKFRTHYLMDTAEPEAVELFLQMTHEKYKKYLKEYFGNTVPLIFTDEIRTPYLEFIYGFEDKFREKYGYDILDYLPVIVKGYAENETEAKILIDYCRICGELYKENLLKEQYSWCLENGILAGGHLDCEHNPVMCRLQGRTNIVDALCQMELPGVDAIMRQIMGGGPGKEAPLYYEGIHNQVVSFYPRVASSAAHINGTNLALTETFAVYGSGLTMDEMRYAINNQLVRGINSHSFMCISYSKEKYYAFAQRPSFGSEKPGYLNLSVINQYTARASYINAVGKSGVEAALYLPANDMYVGGDTCKKARDAYVALGEWLEKQGIAFDIIEDYGIEDAVLTEDTIRIGHAEYKYVYIPENKYMPEESRRKLAPYVKEAVPVCKSSAGFENLRIGKRIYSQDSILYFMYNEGKIPLETTITIPATEEYLYELDALHGQIYAAAYTVEGGEKAIRIRLEPGEEKALLSSSKVYETVENPYLAEYQCKTELKEFTAAKAAAFLLNMAGGFKTAYEPEFAPIELGSWESAFGKDFSGDVIYKTSITMETLPKGAVLIELGKVQHSAKVLVNGKEAGMAGTYPMVITAEGDMFVIGENVIEIMVSNTAANQFVLSGVDKNYKPDVELDDYHEFALACELQTVDGGLYGPVMVKYNFDLL